MTVYFGADVPEERADAILRSGFLPRRLRHVWWENFSWRAVGLILSLLVFLAVFVLMMMQVRSEEKRLEADFGEEYVAYKKKTGRFITFKR